jgi:hypothetical protein
MLRIRIKRRSGAYASSRQDTDYAGDGQEFMGRPNIRGPAVLTWMRVQADLNRCPMRKVLRAVESPLRGYNDLQGGFVEFWSIVAWWSAEESGTIVQSSQERVEASLSPRDPYFPLSRPKDSRPSTRLKSHEPLPPIN